MKIKKIFAAVLSAVLIVMIMSSICVYADGGAKTTHFDITDTEIKAGQAIELNSIDEGLRQAINDTVQNYYGCTVTFKVKYSGFNSPDIFNTYDSTKKAALIGNDYFKAYADISGNYINFKWDEFIPAHNMWGMISNIKFCAGQDVTVTDIYIYVPVQTPKNELAAGAAAYQYVEVLA